MTSAVFKEMGEGVFLATDPIVTINKNDLNAMKQLSEHLPKKRARICAHRNNEAAIHEMIITLQQNSYVRPHLHLNKTESFHIIEGCCDVILFNDKGSITEIISLGDYESGRSFFYRLADPVFHTLLVRSKTVTFHETTNGPFIKGEIIFAPWSPDESDHATTQIYMKEILEKAASFPHSKNLPPL